MPLHTSRIRAICFDVDGTLSDTDDQMVDNLAGMLRPFQFLFPGKELERVARGIVMGSESPGNFLLGLADGFGLDDEIYAFKDQVENFLKKKPAHFRLIPGTRKMLENLFLQYPLAVVSARDAKTTLQFINQFQMAPLFKAIASDQTCSHTKPFADPILWAAKEMGIHPENCLMVGDTMVDIQAGKAAGAQAVGVLCGFGEEKELRSAGADMILGNTSELSLVLDCG